MKKTPYSYPRPFRIAHGELAGQWQVLLPSGEETAPAPTREAAIALLPEEDRLEASVPLTLTSASERAAWLTLNALLAEVGAARLSAPLQRQVARTLVLLEDGSFARSDELQRLIGSNWAICPNTERNRARYARCLTPKQYKEAEQIAIQARVEAVMLERFGHV